MLNFRLSEELKFIELKLKIIKVINTNPRFLLNLNINKIFYLKFKMALIPYP